MRARRGVEGESVYTAFSKFPGRIGKNVFFRILWNSQDKKYYGVVVTEIIQRPLQQCLNIKIMTGNHREKWQHLIKQIEDFAWQNNCDLLELVARPGWKRVLKPFGYKESHVLLEKHNKEKK